MSLKLDNKKSVNVAIIGITAALYIVLGYIFQPISFLGLQFRIAELMIGICILYPYAGLIGNVMGVFFVNLSSPLGAIDLFGAIVNIPALFCIILFKNRKYLKYFGGILYAIIISIYVATILFIVLALPFWLMFLQVLIAETILAISGIFLFKNIGEKIGYYET